MLYSVVIPLKNEEGNILDLVNELEPIMQGLGSMEGHAKPAKPFWELICIDDGSTDNTPKILARLVKQKNYLRVLTFVKNCGQSSAFDAGFKAAQGDFVITLDGDRQNDPADIPKLLKAAAGSDLVCGRRIKRKDTLIKRWTSYCANQVRRRVCCDGVSDTGCSLKIYRRKCLGQIKMFHGMHRFLPALFQIEGFRVIEVPVNHRERVTGQSNYNFLNRSMNTIVDMFAVWWMRKRRLAYKIK